MLSMFCGVPFNPVAVITPPKMDAARSVRVAGQLITLCPADAEARTRRLCDAVHERRDATKAVLAGRKRPAKGLRPVLAALDRAWGGLEGRLESAAQLPSGSELATDAQTLLAKALPEGVSALRAATDDKLLESERMLAAIDAAGLGPEIDRIAGAGFLQGVRDAQQALTEAMGLGTSGMAYGPHDLQVAQTHLLRAIQLYVIQLAGEVDPASEESVRRFDAAVAPLVHARAERVTSPSSDASQSDTTTDPSAMGDAPTTATSPTTAPTSSDTPAATNGAAHA